MDGAETVVNKAAEHGWEAALLSVIIIGGFVLMGWLVHKILNNAAAREARLEVRIKALENYAQSTLSTVLERSTTALVESTAAMKALAGIVERLTTSLDARPCMWSAEKQMDFIEMTRARLERRLEERNEVPEG